MTANTPAATASQREVEHRAKNTLQLISSIVMLQGRREATESAKGALRAVQQRVSAVSVAHRHVAWRDGSEQVEMAALVREIVGDLAASAGRDDVEIRLDLEPLLIPGAHGAPVALLASEAVSNALRHAYADDQPGAVDVRLRRVAGGVELEVTDRGKGMAPGAEKAGFGLMVAQLMAQQIRGRLQMDCAQPGLRVTVVVPMDTSPAKA